MTSMLFLMCLAVKKLKLGDEGSGGGGISYALATVIKPTS